MYNVKNYTEPGGEKTVIGGTLEILDGAEVKGLSPSGEGEAAESEFPSTFQSYCTELLPDEAPNSLIIKVCNAMRRALIQNEMMQGVHQATFAFNGAQDTNNEALKANKNACTFSYNSTDNVLTIECNPDALQELKIDLFPYFNFEPHKYVVVSFDLGNTYATDFGDVQVNCTRYYVGAWSALGVSDYYINVAIAIDTLKPGMNKNAFFIQHEYNERKYFSVNLVVKE